MKVRMLRNTVLGRDPKTGATEMGCVGDIVDLDDLERREVFTNNETAKSLFALLTRLPNRRNGTAKAEPYDR